MSRLARHDVIDPAQVQVLHCIQRCVRRAFLCGDDAFSGQSFEHRRAGYADAWSFSLPSLGSIA